MANIQERRDKNGKLISYSIRVHRGRGADGKQLKPWTSTFEVSPTWCPRSGFLVKPLFRFSICAVIVRKLIVSDFCPVAQNDSAFCVFFHSF